MNKSNLSSAKVLIGFGLVSCMFFFIPKSGAQDDMEKSGEVKADILKEAEVPPPAAPAEAVSTEKEEKEKAKAAEIAKEMENVPLPPVVKKWTPFQLALYSPAQIFSKKYAVYGFNWNFIYSNNVKVYGFDLAPIGMCESKDFSGFQITGLGLAKDVAGVQFSIFGNNARNVDGFQIYVADVYNVDTETLSGARISCFGTWSEIKKMNGFLLAPMVSFCGVMNGFQLSAYHCNAESANGVQFSTGFSYGKEMNGFQFALVNYSKDLSGVQLGILNFAPNNWLPFSIGINFGF